LQKFERIKVCCKAGDLVLFNSKTAHTVTQSQSKKTRMVVYICMLPKKFATKEDIEKKKEFLKNYDTTSHWPCFYLEKTTTYCEDDKFYNPLDGYWKKNLAPKLNDTMLSLVGYDVTKDDKN
jgi:ectoine hydroxylase-related dioxygenase (phytanoyl-CoA dioxygenase family)